MTKAKEKAWKPTPRERIFIQEMCDPRMKGAEAARRAGYGVKSAHVTASQLLSNPNIARAINEAREKHFEALHMGKAEVLAEIAKLARFNVGRILHFTPDGDPYWDLAKATPEDLAAISGAEIEDFVDRRERDAEGNVIARDVRRVKVKTYDKNVALKMIAQAHGLLTDKVEVHVEGSFADDLAEAMMRASRAREK